MSAVRLLYVVKVIVYNNQVLLVQVHSQLWVTYERSSVTVLRQVELTREEMAVVDYAWARVESPIGSRPSGPLVLVATNLP